MGVFLRRRGSLFYAPVVTGGALACTDGVLLLHVLDDACAACNSLLVMNAQERPLEVLHDEGHVQAAREVGSLQ